MSVARLDPKMPAIATAAHAASPSASGRSLRESPESLVSVCASPSGQASEEPGQPPERAEALRKLRALTEVMNPAVGDALSGVLAVEAVLRCRGWALGDWDALYDDLPSKQLKVKARSNNAT